MNRIIVFALILFCMTMQIEAQTLSEEEVTAKMYQAFELNKASKKAEALELFLIVGENTKASGKCTCAVRQWLASVMNCLAGIKKGIFWERTCFKVS